MSFCTVGEAFDNPLRQQIDKFEREHNKNNIFPTQQDESYFDVNGTNISNLKTTDGSGSSFLSSDSEFTDSKFTNSDNSSFYSSETNVKGNKSNKNIHDYSHEYYVQNYIKYMFFLENSNLSKNEVKNIQEHIRTCNFCKNETLLRMKSNETTNIMDFENIKELTIIILVAVIIIILIILFISKS